MTLSARLVRAGARVAVLVIASLTACASTTTRPEALPLGECAVGLWVRTLGPCDCVFASTPECESPTCQQYQTAWAVRADGTHAEFSLRFRTDAPRTLSVVSGVSEGVWEVVDADHLDVHYGSIPAIAPATCTASHITHAGVDFDRAAPEVSDAIVPVLRDMPRWRGVPY